MKPLVSVMMPARNTEKFIEESILSIINQTYDNWELIIVDDNSSDRTGEIARTYERKDSRIKVYKGNGVGVAHTRNQIVELSKGEYIMLQDSDDTSVPERMSKLLNEAVKHEKSYISSNIFFTDLNLNVVRKSRKPENNKEIRAGFKRSYNRETIYTQASFAHKQLYVENKYHEFIKVMSDWDLLLRIGEIPDVYFYNIQEPLYLYRLNEGSLTLNQNNRIPYNLLLRYNEIQRRNSKPEITSMAEFEEIINKSILSKALYKFFYTLKKVQYDFKYRRWSN